MTVNGILKLFQITSDPKTTKRELKFPMQCPTAQQIRKSTIYHSTIYNIWYKAYTDCGVAESEWSKFCNPVKPRHLILTFYPALQRVLCLEQYNFTLPQIQS